MFYFFIYLFYLTILFCVGGGAVFSFSFSIYLFIFLLLYIIQIISVTSISPKVLDYRLCSFPLYSNAQCSSSTILANHSYSSNPNVTYAPHDYPFSPAISFHVRNSFAKQPRPSSSARFSLSHNELVSEGITKRGKFLGQTCIERIRNRFCTVLQTLSLTL